MITERLLQFIWQFQYFSKSSLLTTAGEKAEVLFAGQLNTNEGPDFINARIVIGKTTWAGSVELHIKSSGWYHHAHHTDANYKNVILHVVWEDDGTNSDLPVLVLQDRVSSILLKRYEALMNASSFIPCQESIQMIKSLTWSSWKDRLLAERLLRKSGIIESYLEENNYHWEETFWWLLARNFGIRVNADAFEKVARSVPVTLLAKHKNQIHQLEALLLGQAGLLDGNYAEAYPRLLQKEYNFYKKKYRLRPIHIPVFFLRMRPGNFPTVRLAQLAMLIQHSSHLFSAIRDAGSVNKVKAWLDVTANDYWHYHYRFDEESTYRQKKLGAAMIDNIIINTVCPVLFAYGNYHRENIYKDKALNWLGEISAEKNNITKGFQQLGVDNKHAFDSQALIELKNEYCNKKRCLECGIGNVLLKN